MNNYIEYYQFHEKDKDGNDVCMYCFVKLNAGNITFHFTDDFGEALDELREFAYNNNIYNPADLLESDKLHLQVSNQNFRDFLWKKYRCTTEAVDNFHDSIGEDIVVPNKLDFATILNSKAVINGTPENEEENPKKAERKAKREARKKAIKEKGFFGSIKEKLGNYITENGIKKFVIRAGLIFGAITALGVGAGKLKACGSKSGTTDDLVVEYNNDDDNNYTYNKHIDPEQYAYDGQDPQDLVDDDKDLVDMVPTVTPTPDYSKFDDCLANSDAVTKNYMNKFRYNLKNFNSLARNYVDSSKNSRLGLDTSDYTVLQMALLGENFGDNVTNVSKYWNYSYEDYKKVNSQIKQLATVQKDTTGFSKVLKNADDQAFYEKYENLIIDLNRTTDDDEKIEKAETILAQIKEDFKLADNLAGKENLFRGNSKYIATMPLVRSFYDRAKNCGYDNAIDSTEMAELSQAYKTVVRENITAALNSVKVNFNASPSYTDFAEAIKSELEAKNLYVIDDTRDITDTALYQKNKELPHKVVVAETTETTTEPVVTETASDNYDYYATSTASDNYTYTDDTSSSDSDTSYDDSSSDSSSDDTSSDDSSSDTDDSDSNEDDNTNEDQDDNSSEIDGDQIIEGDEGENENTNTDNSSSDDTTTDDDQIIESEEDIAGSINDTINSGGTAEIPDGWQIDDDYKDGNTIDGSVSDITIEGNTDTSSGDISSAEEEVPTYEENNTSDVATYSTDTYTEETPVYDDTATQDVETYSDVSSYDEGTTSDVDTYSTDTYTEEAPVYEGEVASNEDNNDQVVASMTPDAVVDQVLSYNANGINAVPVYDANTGSWHAQIVDEPTQNENVSRISM